MIEHLENQLAQLIVYIGSIDALAEAYRAADGRDNDRFLFGAVYDGLWDAGVVRICALWDKRRGVASLPKLATLLKSLANPDARAIAGQINTAAPHRLTRLKARRDKIVAHSEFPLDAHAFDTQFSLDIEDLRGEAEWVETILAGVRKACGGAPMSFDAIKSEAVSSARNSLSKRHAKLN